jgi:ACS family glucarate transporter-like MFS transporter
MMRDLGFSQIDMGRLFSAFLLGYALFQVPAGAAADRWGARVVLACAAFAWLLVVAVMAALGGKLLGGTAVSAFVVLLGLRFVLGVMESPTFPAAAQGVAQWIAPIHQGSANGIVMAAIGAGSAVAPAVLSRVMVRWGWRPAMLASALPALARRLHMDGPAFVAVAHLGGRPRRPFLQEMLSLFGSRSFVLLTVSYTLEGYVAYIFIFWFYLYLVDVRHFDLLRTSSLSSLSGILSIISIPSGGIISDKLVTGRMGARWGGGRFR